MDLQLAKLVSAALGRTVEPEDEGSLADLNELPPRVLEAARRVPAMRRALLEWLTGVKNLGYLDAFEFAVFERGEDPAQWMRGAVLIPDVGLAELATTPLPAIYERLGGAPTVRVRPTQQSFDAGNNSVGAPAVLRAEMRYFDAKPPGVSRYATSLEHDRILDPILAGRRWIAARAARGKGTLAELKTPLSDDARIAIAALAREEGPGVPGFRGPDDWYL